MRLCGAGAGTGAVLRNGAGMVRVRFAGAGAVIVRIKFFAHFEQREIPKQLSRSKILNMAWNPYISIET